MANVTKETSNGAVLAMLKSIDKRLVLLDEKVDKLQTKEECEKYRESFKKEIQQERQIKLSVLKWLILVLLALVAGGAGPSFWQFAAKVF